MLLVGQIDPAIFYICILYGEPVFCVFFFICCFPALHCSFSHRHHPVNSYQFKQNREKSRKTRYYFIIIFSVTDNKTFQLPVYQFSSSTLHSFIGFIRLFGFIRSNILAIKTIYPKKIEQIQSGKFSDFRNKFSLKSQKNKG